MKRIYLTLFLMVLCLPMFAQRADVSNRNVSVELESALKAKKNAWISLAACGAVWITGEVIYNVQANRYANERWDGQDMEDFVKLYQEGTKKQPGCKLGQTIAIGGFLGTVASGIVVIRTSKAVKRLSREWNNDVALMDFGLSPTGATLTLTF